MKIHAALTVAALALAPTLAFAQSATVEGARSGAAAGTAVGGPVGGAVGGTVGAAVGTAVDIPAAVISAVTGLPGPSVVVRERVVVGEPLPVHDCMGVGVHVEGRPWGVLTLDALATGTFGAAAAAAKLYGLSAERIVAAFGVSGSQAAGSLQFLLNGAWNKRYQVGAAAMNGVIAATLARNGFIGATEAVEGRHGLLVGYSDDAHPDKAAAGLGRVYDTMNIGVKPYPSCRYTHAAIDALIALRREHNLTPDTIRRVEIGLHRNGITLTGDAATKRHARSVVDGQFSMFFTAALALDQGSFGWDDYARLGDPAIEALADKIAVVQDARLEGRSHPFGARVSIDAGGETLERLVPDPSGEPSLFPDAPAMRQKFLQLARPVLDGGAERFADAILALDSVARVDAVTALARP